MSGLMTDLSNNNGAGVNVEAVLSVNAALSLKASESTSFTDPDFAGWYRRAHATGKPDAPYHFAQPGVTSGTAEAQHFCAVVEAAGLGAPWRIVYDFEVTHTDPHNSTVHALDFLGYVQQRWPQTARTFYTYPGFASEFVADPALARMSDLWIAAYPGGYSYVPNPFTVRQQPPIAPWTTTVAWQYTSIDSTVPGIGRSDRSIVYPAWFAGSPMEDDTMAVTDQQAAAITFSTAATASILSQVSGLAVPEAIERLYADMLGRPPDPGGLAYWIKAVVVDGVSWHDVVLSFWNARQAEASNPKGT